MIDEIIFDVGSDGRHHAIFIEGGIVEIDGIDGITRIIIVDSMIVITFLHSFNQNSKKPKTILPTIHPLLEKRQNPFIQILKFLNILYPILDHNRQNIQQQS